MSLKSKAAIIFLAILLLYGTVDYAVQRCVVLPGFISLERSEARKDLERVVEAIKVEIRHLGTFCSDWAAWDDTYAFMVSPSKEYIRSNLVLSTFTDNEINLIYFVGPDGKVVWGRVCDLETGKRLSLKEFQRDFFPGEHPLVGGRKSAGGSSQEAVSGVFTTEKGPMLVAASPILTSENRGPCRGTLIMGRFLDGKLIKRLENQSKVAFSIRPPGQDPPFVSSGEVRHSGLPESGCRFKQQGLSTLLISTVFPDVTGRPAFVITAKIPTAIISKGYETTRYAALLGFASMLLALAVMFLVLRRTILRPIVELKDHAFTIGETGDLSARVSTGRRDEIGKLAREFDGMMERLKQRSDDLTKLNEQMKRDIAVRTRAEDALRESEERFRLHFENVSDVIFSTDNELKIRTVSPSVEKALGYQPEEMIGASIGELNVLAPEDLERALRDVRKVLAGERVPTAVYDFIAKDGTRRTGEISGSPLIRNGKVMGAVSVARDITDRRRLEVQLQHAQTMEAIATLAGGIAHEFNNALMGIMGNVELLRMDLPPDTKWDGYFETIKDSGHRMSRLTDQLLAYAQGGKYQPRDLRLDEFVIETLPILQHELDSGVRVETSFEKDIPPITADQTQMQMVLSAILSNSNEAMEGEGIIKIRAGKADVDEILAKGRPGFRPGFYVYLTVEDDGRGMDEKTREAIFKPFFTTKFQGRGMGMAAVYGIVKNHGGWIYVDSEPGEGTVVEIYFPVLEVEAEDESIKEGMRDLEPARGSGTILLVEDEDVVVEVTLAMLETLGYRVVVARTGKEAIEMAETFDGPLEIALLDIKLPDMEGGKVYPLLMKARPDLKVIVCSAYSIEGPARKILDAGAQDFLQKPFSIASVAEKLKAVLGQE